MFNSARFLQSERLRYFRRIVAEQLRSAVTKSELTEVELKSK
jgi:hypothetical protein